MIKNKKWIFILMPIVIIISSILFIYLNPDIIIRLSKITSPQRIDFNMGSNVEIQYKINEENILPEEVPSESIIALTYKKAQKITKYSIQTDFEKEKIFLGYISGEKKYSDDREKLGFVQYKDEIITYRIGDSESIDIKGRIKILDLDENDGHIEFSINSLDTALNGTGESIVFRIKNGRLIKLGNIYGTTIIKDKNKYYDEYSYLGFIEEAILVCHYEIVGDELKHIYEFADGRQSVDNEEKKADYSKISNKYYTVKEPLYITTSFWAEERNI